MKEKQMTGHLVSIFTIVVWGTTYISTKVLLQAFEPIEILFIRFVMAGICLISFEGSALQVNPLGDLLAVLAAITWAVYSVLSRKISSFGYSTIQSTRRTFAWGLLFMIPALFIFRFRLGPERFCQPVYVGNLLFLGLGASALCFVTWNYAVKILGAVKTSVYIYMTPVITVVTSILILHEKITVQARAGIALTLVGLVVSEWKGHEKMGVNTLES